VIRQKINIKLFTWVVLLICVLIYLKLSFNYRFIQDDAFITFRYVKNFLAGIGLVFNHGEFVESYTNFLWVVILSGLGYLGVDFVSVSQILSVSFGAISLSIVYFISANNVFVSTGKSYQKIFALFPVYLLAMNGSFIYWSVSGMETNLFIMLVLSGINYYLKFKDSTKPNYLFVLFFVPASFTRPEGIYLFSLIFVYKLFLLLMNKKRKDRNTFNHLIIEFLLFSIPILLFTLFRFFYYGYIFPNTFYAKTGFSDFYLLRGIRYLWSFADSVVLLPVTVSCLLLLFIFKKNRKDYAVKLFFFIAFCYIISIVVIGGDVLPLYRFFLPILPLLFIIFSKFLFDLTNWISKYFRLNNLSILSLIIVSVLILGFTGMRNESDIIQNYRGYELGLVKKMKVYANWIRDKQIGENKTVTVAMSTIGAFSYYSNAKVIDIIGLTDEFIAHNPVKIEGIENKVNVLWKERRYNVDYVLAQKPDYIIFPAGLKPSAYPEAALFSRKEFHKNYYTQIFYSQEMNQMLPIFTKRNKSQLGMINASLFNKPSNIKFTADYIDANNLLLTYSKSHSSKIKNQIIRKCMQSATESPWSADKAYSTAGTLYYFDGNYKKAIISFKEALKVNPLNSVAHFYLKDIYYKQNDKEQMMKHLIKLKKISPDAIAYFSLN